MNVENILLDCDQSFQFINGLGNAIFSAEVNKAQQKLGLLRLIIPQFTKRIDTLLKKASQVQNQQAFDVKRLLGELIIK